MDPINKSIFQTIPIRINKVNIADENCSDENLFVSFPIVFRNDETFKELGASEIRFKDIVVEIIPKYNKVGPSDVLNTDEAAYITGMFPVKYNFQTACYIGDGALKKMAPFEVGGVNSNAESTAIIKFRLPTSKCYLCKESGVSQTFKPGESIDCTNIGIAGQDLVFGQVTLGVNRDNFIVSEGSQNVAIGREINKNAYAKFLREINREAPKKKGTKKQNPPDGEVFVEDPINGRLLLDYSWTANIRYDFSYTRSAKARSTE